MINKANIKRTVKPTFFHILTLFLVCVLFSGCLPFSRSPETRYHVMTLPEGRQASSQREITGIRVGVGPVIVPGYLDHQRIFIRQGNATRVELDEYERWGECVSDGVTRLLVEDLSLRLARSGGVALPLRAGVPFDARVTVDIIRFDGAPGGEVVLDAVWGVLSTGADALREGQFSSTVTAGPGIDGLVSAHGELVSRLGQAIAESLVQSGQPGLSAGQ